MLKDWLSRTYFADKAIRICDNKMKPVVKILMPKEIREEMANYVRSQVNANYGLVEILFEFTEDVSVPTVASLARNGADFGSIDDDIDAPSIALLRGIQSLIKNLFRAQL